MLFAAGVSSNLTVTSIIGLSINIIASGIFYDAVKGLFLNLKGDNNMNRFSLLLIIWLGCCGDMV